MTNTDLHNELLKIKMEMADKREKKYKEYMNQYKPSIKPVVKEKKEYKLEPGKYYESRRTNDLIKVLDEDKCIVILSDVDEGICVTYYDEYGDGNYDLDFYFMDTYTAREFYECTGDDRIEITEEEFIRKVDNVIHEFTNRIADIKKYMLKNTVNGYYSKETIENIIKDYYRGVDILEGDIDDMLVAIHIHELWETYDAKPVVDKEGRVYQPLNDGTDRYIALIHNTDIFEIVDDKDIEADDVISQSEFKKRCHEHMWEALRE